MSNIAELAAKYEQYVIDTRRDFHMHPELSLKEDRTVRRIEEELDKLSIPHVRVGHNNVVGTLEGAKPGRKIAIRADIDALPVQEARETSYKSQVDGVMHACGHDAHTAMLLGTAHVLSDIRDELCGTVYLCFQVAEEVGAGAGEIVAYLKEIGGVDQVIGTHIAGELAPGTIQLPDGPMMAGALGFDITVKGRGGHGSRPDRAIDPIKPACDILLKIAMIPAQYHNPFDTCVVSPCQITAGNKNNIIPETAFISGNIRFFKYGDGDKIFEKIREIATCTAKAYGAEVELKSVPMAPNPLINDKAAAAQGRKIAERVGLEVVELEPTAGSDNFADFLVDFPGFYCQTGAHLEGASGNHHNPNFDLEESAFKKVVEFFATYTADFLK